ncbi:MAG: hypothetical protein Q4G11_06505 [Gallicola sp.]|nr:hypothetical protein [Gallicola sp.]
MFDTYTDTQPSSHIKLAIKVMAVILIFSLFTLAFAPPVHANTFKKIAIYLGVVAVERLIGDLIWDGAKWVASTALTAALTYPAIAAGIAVAGVAAGCTYMIYSMPTDTYPKAYKPNAYWDHNNGYWVTMYSNPVDLNHARIEVKHE